MSNAKRAGRIQPKGENAAITLHELGEENALLRLRVQQAEQALQESEARFNKFAKASAVLIDTFLLRPDGSVAIPYASPAIQEMFALNPEDVAQDASEVFRRIHPDDNTIMQRTIGESARTLAAWRCEFRVHHPRKGLIWVEGNSIPEKLDDGSILWHGILTDITQRKIAEQELRDTKERLELTYQMSGSGAWEWDIDTQENLWSEGLWALYGLPTKSCQPSYEAWFAAIHPEDRAACEAALQTAVRNQESMELEWRVAANTDSERWLWSRGQPIFDEQGRLRRYRGIVLDVTRRKRSELEIHALNARILNAQEEERQRVARDLHDDLTQQIAALSLGVGTVKRYIPKEETAGRERTDQLQQKIIELSESVRRISRQLHPTVLEYSGLSAALKTHCREFADLTGLKVSYAVRGTVANPEKTVALHLYRIVQEALHNVWKHAQVQEAQVELKYDAGDWLELTIADHGVGINMAQSKRVKGLGLVSIQERARLIGGRAEVESRPGKGTTVRVIVKPPATIVNR